ncbi:hypothetical protein MHYP_G00310880 [Metynnis hypsauchen]
MKRKDSIHSFFSPKRKAREIENEQLSKVNGEYKVEGERRGGRREKIKTRWKEREKGNRNVTKIEYKAKTTRDRGMWENTTVVKIWRRESIIKMRREKARNKITCRVQTMKGKGECLSHHQRSPVRLVHMTYPSPGVRCQYSQCERVSLRPSREELGEAFAATGTNLIPG